MARRREKPLRTIAHIQRTIDRDRRDVALMRGELPPADGDVDDLAILERFQTADNKKRLIGDYKLSIKTLEATLEILREEL